MFCAYYSSFSNLGTSMPHKLIKYIYLCEYCERTYSSELKCVLHERRRHRAKPSTSTDVEQVVIVDDDHTVTALPITTADALPVTTVDEETDIVEIPMPSTAHRQQRVQMHVADTCDLESLVEMDDIRRDERAALNRPLYATQQMVCARLMLMSH
jgi:hypothetical protein